MTALDLRERARLDRFINLLLFPALGPDEDEATHKGVARALLASKIHWPAADLAFLRRVACLRLANSGEWPRLLGLWAAALERAA